MDADCLLAAASHRAVSPRIPLPPSPLPPEIPEGVSAGFACERGARERGIAMEEGYFKNGESRIGTPVAPAGWRFI